MTHVLKVSLSIAGLSNAKLLIFTNAVLAGFLLSNLLFPNPSPAYLAMIALRNNFSTAIDNAHNGGKILNAILREQRRLLIDALRDWARYVELNGQKDRIIMEGSGFKINGGPRVRRGLPGDVVNLQVTDGHLRGTVKATVNVVPNADSYELEYTKDRDIANATWFRIAGSTSSRMLIKGLTGGDIIAVRVRAVNTHGEGNWSEVFVFEYVR